MVHPIIAFYDPDIRAPYSPRDPVSTLEDILLWTNAELEKKHDYIQHLFPLPERSGVQPDAPLITQEIRTAFHTRRELRFNMKRAWTRMMLFYGFVVVVDDASGEPQPISEEAGPKGVSVLEPHSHFRHLAEKTWLRPFDHNHLRITRIVRSMRILGLWREAQNMLGTLLWANTVAGAIINARTIAIWFDTAGRPLCYPPNYPREPVCGWLVGADPELDGTSDAAFDPDEMPSDYEEGDSFEYTQEPNEELPGIFAPHFPEVPQVPREDRVGRDDPQPAGPSQTGRDLRMYRERARQRSVQGESSGRRRDPQSESPEKTDD